jgi:hypothetical protein
MLEQIPPTALTVIGVLIGLVVTFAATKYLSDEQTERLETTIQDILEQSGTFHSPVVKKKDVSFLDDTLEERLDNYSNIDLYYADSTYYLPDKHTDMESVKEFDVLNKLPYRPERYDSDDYSQSFSILTSFIFGVNSIGTVIEHDSNEAYNIIVYADGLVEFYDAEKGETLVDYEPDEAAIIF